MEKFGVEWAARPKAGIYYIMHNMQIAFITPEILPMPPLKGGAVEYWINEAAHRLPYSQKYILCCADKNQQQRESIGDVNYLRYKKGFIGWLLTLSYKLPFKQEHSKYWQFPYSFWCAWKLRGVRPDIVHIHNRPQFVWVIALLNRRSKIILHLHQISAVEDCRALWTDKLFHAVTTFVGSSKFISQYLQNTFPIIALKTRHVYNAIDLAQYQVPAARVASLINKYELTENDFVFLYAGRLTEPKGCHVLIDAIRSFAGEHLRSIKLIVCGSAGYSDMTETPYIRKLKEIAFKSKNPVIFAGYINAVDMAAYYSLADVVVIPSIVPEGFCFVTIEAIASRNTVIASNGGALPEVLALFRGMQLFECGNVKALRDCIHKSMVVHATEVDQKYNLKVVQETFSWDAVVGKLDAVYKGIA